MKRIILPLLTLILLLICSACGNKQAAKVLNYSQPDVNSFNEVYYSEMTARRKSAAIADAGNNSNETFTVAAQEYDWLPEGVYSYVKGDSDSDMWSKAEFNIESVNPNTHTACISYDIQDQRGYTLAGKSGSADKDSYFRKSDGIVAVGCDVTTAKDGTRTIKLYIDDLHWLEFTGKECIETADYRFSTSRYSMEHNG